MENKLEEPKPKEAKSNSFFSRLLDRNSKKKEPKLEPQPEPENTAVNLDNILSKSSKEFQDNNRSIITNALKGLGVRKTYNLAMGKGKITQKDLNKIVGNLSQNNIIDMSERINFNEDVIQQLKVIANKVNLNPENINKFRSISKKLKINDSDFDSVIQSLNTSLNENDNIDIDEVKSLLFNLNDSNGLNIDDLTKQDVKEPIEKFIDNVETPKIQNEEYAKKLNSLRRIIKKVENGKELTQKEKDNYTEILYELQNINEDDKDKNEIENYLDIITSKFDIDKNANINSSNKTIVDFKQIASVFRTALIIMITICIVVYIFVVIISTINVFYLLYKIFSMIGSLFYNSVITNNQTLSYNAKQIVKITKNNTKYDIFNIITEQEMAITVFNTSIYIIYILMAYVITFILCVIYTQIYRFTHVLNGKLSDIDSKYEILSIIAIIFIFGIIHLLIYKFLFKNIAMSSFRNINNFESNVDKTINYIILPKENNTNECVKFYELLSDTSKRNEIDIILSDKVANINTNTNDNDIRKYLMMYNIYMYFEEYLYMNDVMKDKIGNYFGIINDDNEIPETITLIGLLDSNERKLLKVYHENLPFHSLIPSSSLEKYQKINEDITQAINSINKQIIKYTGTFFPFLITCLYIFLICIYNIYTFYIILKYVVVTEKDNLFITFIYSFSHKYIYYCEKIYSIIFNK